MSTIALLWLDTKILATDLRFRVKTLVKAAKFLVFVRAALPRWLQWLVIVAVTVKAVTTPLPIDGGIDELLLVVAGACLWFRHRALLRVCWNEAKWEVLLFAPDIPLRIEVGMRGWSCFAGSIPARAAKPARYEACGEGAG